MQLLNQGVMCPGPGTVSAGLLGWECHGVSSTRELLGQSVLTVLTVRRRASHSPLVDYFYRAARAHEQSTCS